MLHFILNLSVLKEKKVGTFMNYNYNNIVKTILFTII